MLGIIGVTLLVTVLMVFLFGLTIFVHELGHFLAARALGLVVETFSIGFGPALWQKRINGVVYKIGAIPLGGYVALPQLDPTAMAAVQGKGEASTESGESDATEDSGKAPGARRAPLPAVAPWRKILVSLAGSAGNVCFAILLAWVIFWTPAAITGGDDARIGMVDADSAAYAAGLRTGDVILAVNGRRVSTWAEFLIETHLTSVDDVALLEVAGPEADPQAQKRELELPVTLVAEALRGIAGVYPQLHSVVTAVTPDSPAAQAGIEVEDRIVSLNNRPVAGTQHLIDLLAEHGARVAEIVVLRAEQTHSFRVVPRMDPDRGRPLIGVQLGDVYSTTPMWMQYRRPLRQIQYDYRQISRILQALTAPRTRGERGQAARSLGGPLQILVVLWLSVRASVLSSLGFVRFLNVNLAILNLLPIPVLDGGHILFSLWEMITRRRIHPRVINFLVNLFALLLILAVLLITRNDVVRIWRQLRPRAAVVEVEPEAGSVDPASEDVP